MQRPECPVPTGYLEWTKLVKRRTVEFESVPASHPDPWTRSAVLEFSPLSCNPRGVEVSHAKVRVGKNPAPPQLQSPPSSKFQQEPFLMTRSERLLTKSTSLAGRADKHDVADWIQAETELMELLDGKQADKSRRSRNSCHPEYPCPALRAQL